ncbi:hypothetical protein C8R43DRAFT_944897 [Mycena crocata]|nr:hypothetical protein C8R43DRAFT_944897 [Mycena crocata]
MSRVKHLLSGGYWQDSLSKRWIQAGSAVQNLLQEDRVLQRHLGWVSAKKVDPGIIKVLSLKRKPAFQWISSVATKYCTFTEPPSPQSTWRSGRSLTTNDGDEVAVGSWVIAKQDGRTIFGRINELLVGSEDLVTLEQFKLGGELHPILSWPVLQRPSGEEIISA